mmetsp:Transcript_16253/g.35301  ORF Transcript_16253/g.35301 Transcript_16253/m.35301 type:complete len:233 (-) Transcript_16253:236-934(-)
MGGVVASLALLSLSPSLLLPESPISLSWSASKLERRRCCSVSSPVILRAEDDLRPRCWIVLLLLLLLLLLPLTTALSLCVVASMVVLASFAVVAVCSGPSNSSLFLIPSDHLCSALYLLLRSWYVRYGTVRYGTHPSLFVSFSPTVLFQHQRHDVTFAVVSIGAVSRILHWIALHGMALHCMAWHGIGLHGIAGFCPVERVFICSSHTPNPIPANRSSSKTNWSSLSSSSSS